MCGHTLLKAPSADGAESGVWFRVAIAIEDVVLGPERRSGAARKKARCAPTEVEAKRASDDIVRCAGETALTAYAACLRPALVNVAKIPDDSLG
jgi:hypothetical protein